MQRSGPHFSRLRFRLPGCLLLAVLISLAAGAQERPGRPAENRPAPQRPTVQRPPQQRPAQQRPTPQ
ncbi:MAG TPA: hypothetical protein VK563_19085, partial [Puia sp.]|nr:hypothetical protein [Puia sp.]